MNNTIATRSRQPWAFPVTAASTRQAPPALVSAAANGSQVARQILTASEAARLHAVEMALEQALDRGAAPAFLIRSCTWLYPFPAAAVFGQEATREGEADLDEETEPRPPQHVMLS